MAHILSFPIMPRSRPWPPSAEPIEAWPDTLTTALAALDALLDTLRAAWWDGSSLALSRGGLEALVGLEPGDATPRRRVSA